MNMQELNEGELWLAEFPFEEGNSKKLRPVFILDVTPYGVKAAIVSTKHVSISTGTEVSLTEEEAHKLGLHHASRIDFGKRAWIVRADLKRRLGDIGMPGEKLPEKKFREFARAVANAGY